MKNLKSLLLLFVVALLMTACEKESTQELLIQEPETLEAKMQEEYEAYLAEHGEVQIEYTTLEELNRVYIENGLEPVTLEEIGITEEEYGAAQERIHSKEYAQARASCVTHSWYVYLADMNGSGTMTVYDTVLAQRAIDRVIPFTYRAENFGLISYYKYGTEIPLRNFDINIVKNMLLGVITC